MGKKNPAHERRAKDAAERAAAAGELTPQQKLERLDRNLGVGVGAKKERARLAAKLTKSATSESHSKSTLATAPAEYVQLEGAVQLMLSAGKVTIVVFGKQPIPVLSMSQLRRMGDQHGFDGNEFARKYREVLP